MKPIATRQEFDIYLRDARYEIDKLAAQDPADRTLTSIVKQLEYIENATSTGANLDAATKKRLTMGLLAHRELKGEFENVADLIIALHNFIDQRMPTA